MAPSRRKGPSKAAAVAQRQWKFRDLVLAKVSESEKWGYPADWKKVLVFFFGTQQIAFCNPADVEAFAEEKESLLGKRQGTDFIHVVQEIIGSYEKLKKQNQVDEIKVAKVPYGNTNSEPSPVVIVKVSSRVPLQISDHRSKCMDFKVKLGEKEPHLCRNDVEGVAQNEDIEYRKRSEELIIDDVKETYPIIYLFLKKEIRRFWFEKFHYTEEAIVYEMVHMILLFQSVEKNVGKLVGVSSLNSVMEGTGRSKRTRRNLDGSK